MAEYQVVDKEVLDADLKSIGDSIRAKGGTTELFNSAKEMKDAVDAIQTGGKAPVIQPLSVTENGEYTAPPGVDGYSPVSVNVPTGGDYFQEDGLISGSSNSYENPRVTKIAPNVFKFNDTITSYEFPNVEIISAGSFDSCKAQYFKAGEKTVQIGGKASFSGCRQLVDVLFPGGIEITGTLAFNDCVELNPVKIIQVFGRLSQWDFRNCQKLQTIDVSAVTDIGWKTFEGCFRLTKLDFHKLKSIGNVEAFLNCTSLVTVIIRSTPLVPLKDINNFTGTPIASGTGYIYVPRALVDQYKAATNWVTYAAQIRAIEDYPDITGG